MQGSESGEHREAHLKLWMARPAEQEERIPGGMHLLDVIDECRPPAGNALGAAGWVLGRSWVHEQGAAACLEDVQQRRDALVSRYVKERGGRQTQPDETEIEVAPSVAGSTAVRLAAAHARKGRGSASAPS